MSKCIRISVAVVVAGVTVYLLMGEAAVRLLGEPRLLWRPSLALFVVGAMGFLWLELDDQRCGRGGIDEAAMDSDER
jgi:hypothetical protein